MKETIGNFLLRRLDKAGSSRYNDIANWRYTDLPSAFYPESTAEC
jgi:TPP-dependent 2-oxoacid decarboxylase